MIAELGSEAALLDKIMREAVATGEVEHTVDKETGLDIFNHLSLHGRPATPLQNVCRGLIACLRTAEVVATPFPRFRDQLFVGDRQNEIARAAFKIDGSLAIVFLWNGELHVSTRRRMDSQQALWTKTWLRAHTDMGEYELGWTYLFEAVFQDNRVVVPYPFDAPVLLAAVSPSGERASHAECVNMAYRMGVMLAPSVVGQLKEIESNLASIMCKDHLPPTHEGWIVTTSNGTNTKLVLPAYMRASAEASRLHPLEVWDRVRTGGESRSGMLHLKGLAEHHSQELSRILDALQAAYSKAHDGAGPACMHYSRFDEDHGHTRARLLDSIRPGFMHSFRFDEDHRHTRALLLDSIKPGFDGTLEGYEPAGFMVNTFAKGWAQGVIKTGRFSQEPLIQSKLSDPSILGLVLESLDGHDMGRAMLVNRKWSSIIRSAPGFEAKVEEVPIKGINWNRRSSNPYSSSDDERGGWGGAGYSHGYGSD
jgi:RNA ligase